jgi:hypothetical protein
VHIHVCRFSICFDVFAQSSRSHIKYNMRSIDNCFSCFQYHCVHYFKGPFNKLSRGVRGRAVKVVNLKPLSPHRCEFESRHGLWILSCKEAIQLACGTSVVLLRCPFVPEIMHGRTPKVFLYR